MEIGIRIFGKRQELLGDANSQRCQTLTPISRESFTINEPFFTPTNLTKSNPNQIVEKPCTIQITNKKNMYKQPIGKYKMRTKTPIELELNMEV